MECPVDLRLKVAALYLQARKAEAVFVRERRDNGPRCPPRLCETVPRLVLTFVGALYMMRGGDRRSNCGPRGWRNCAPGSQDARVRGSLFAPTYGSPQADKPKMTESEPKRSPFEIFLRVF